ncbi:MAG: hypothetical protein K2X41_02340 [Hyphomicrobium sp.]|nr:hypothetical protein [Hyphomicrobium sp.]
MSALSRSAFHALSDFGAAGQHSIEIETDIERERRFQASLEQAADQGYQRGFVEGQAQAEVEASASERALRAAFDVQLEEHRQIWESTLSQGLAEQISSGLADLVAAFESSASALLKPWLVAQLHQRAVADFVATVEKVATEAVTVHIEGSEAIVAKLSAALADGSAAVTASITPAPSVRVIVDRTTIDFHFAEWLLRLEGHCE